jgi:dolichyl-phosphate-mannose-protein mannosyltransferase
MRPIVGIVAGWIVGRALAVFWLTIVGSTTGQRIEQANLVAWDGGWYRVIMLNGYTPRPERWPPRLGDWTTYPFFPLFPYSARLINDVIGRPVISLVLIPNLAALVGAIGIYRLARQLYSPRTAMIAAWFAGLLPGTLTFSMAYPDSLFMAASVWAVVLVTERRPFLASLVVLVATTSRPNGVLLLLPIALLVWQMPPPTLPATEPRWRPWASTMVILTVPSAVFMALWSWFMHHRTGDPIAYFTAKAAWKETTFVEWLGNFDRQATFQLLVGGAALAVVLVVARRHPPAWTLHALVCVVPALALGMVGMIRYTAQTFVVPIALAAMVAGRRRVFLGAAFATLVTVTAIYSVLIIDYSWVP